MSEKFKPKKDLSWAESLRNARPGNKENINPSDESYHAVEGEKDSHENKVESIKDLAGIVVDNESAIAEEQEAGKADHYKEVLKSVETVEPIPESTKQTIAEYKQRIEDWKSLTTISATDTGMGGLGSFNGVADMKAIIKRYPGVESVASQLQEVEKKNKTGWKFWKDPDINDYQFALIRNHLTTGSLGNFSTKEEEAKAQQFVTEYLADNKVELGEGEEKSVKVENFAQAILGNKSMAYYQNEIESLEKNMAA